MQVSVLSEANTPWGRFLDYSIRGFLRTPRHDCVLLDVFGHRAFAYESIAILYACFWGIRLVVSLHTGSMPDFVRRWPRWSRWVLSLPDLVLAPHAYLQERLSALGIRIDDTIPNFIDIADYRFRERSILAPRFLYLRGTDSTYYDAVTAIRAFALVQQRYAEATLTVAGREGDRARFCRELVVRLGLRGVDFVGMVPKREIPRLGDGHDIHMHAAFVDNMPVTVLEMWACGLPTVATRVGGVPHLIRDGADGILVDCGDYRAMAEACLRLLSNRELADRLSRSGRARAERFSWEAVRSRWSAAICGGDAGETRADFQYPQTRPFDGCPSSIACRKGDPHEGHPR
jgi:glycosyltransferase involved in cell wall biosynthesis